MLDHLPHFASYATVLSQQLLNGERTIRYTVNAGWLPNELFVGNASLLHRDASELPQLLAESLVEAFVFSLNRCAPWMQHPVAPFTPGAKPEVCRGSSALLDYERRATAWNARPDVGSAKGWPVAPLFDITVAITTSRAASRWAEQFHDAVLRDRRTSVVTFQALRVD